MWFVFPQLAGLGHSAMAQRFAISDMGEAQAYLAHPLLGPRLGECTEAMLGWAGRRDVTAILGSIDALKFASSMTLFEAAAGGEHFSQALQCFYGGKRDSRTLKLLASAT